MLALLLMVGSFYTGTLFGNKSPIYVPQLPSNLTSAGTASFIRFSSALSLSGTPFFLTFCFTYVFVFRLRYSSQLIHSLFSLNVSTDLVTVGWILVGNFKLVVVINS